jgi:hypothetical protein
LGTVVFCFGGSLGTVVHDVSNVAPRSRTTAEIRNRFIGFKGVRVEPVQADRKLQAIKENAGNLIAADLRLCVNFPDVSLPATTVKLARWDVFQ